MRQLLLFISVLFCAACFAQEKNVSGVIADLSTKEPIPFANVYIKNTTKGTITGFQGEFNINTNSDSLWVSAVGYLTKTITIPTSNSKIYVNLEPDIISLSEIKVTPSNQRVNWILNKVKENKKINNPERFNSYEYEKYSKWDYAITNVSKSLLNSRLFKDKQHLFQINNKGQKSLPVYFSEQVVYNKFQRNPQKEKSIILADNTSGLGVLDSYEFSGYSSGLSDKQNFYDNYINYYEQNFVSPVANNGKFYYRYYLVDSVQLNGNKCFKIEFYPKRKGENVFKGYMLIDDERFAIRKIDASLSEESQLNFIKSLKVKSEFEALNDSVMFYKENRLCSVFDYMPVKSDSSKKRMELTYNKYTSYSKVQIEPAENIKLSSKNINYEVLKSKDYNKKNTAYWKNVRHKSLDSTDIVKYAIIDSINQIKQVKVVNELAKMGLNGYLDLGKFEIGPYPEFLQSNKVEGSRFYFGGRTSSEISENWMFFGGLSYGTRTKLYSGSGGVGYRFNSAMRKVFKFQYEDRFLRMGENKKILFLYENMLNPSETNLVSSLFARDEFDELYRQQGVYLSYENEWRTGFSSTFFVDAKKQYSPEFYPFTMNGQRIDEVEAIEGGVTFRISKKETVLDDGFMRKYISTKYPILNISLSGGKVFYGNEYSWYAKAHATVKGKTFFGQSYLNYAFEAGKIFGRLPYTMLEIPRGNETYGYYLYDFNLINYLEFIHDEYIHSYVEYHLNGFIFNRMPLLKKLGLREVVSAKAMLGNLTNNQFNGIEMPLGSGEVDNAYLEVGAGLENVLRFFRIEGVWRVTPTSQLNVPDFGVRVKFEVKL